MAANFFSNKARAAAAAQASASGASNSKTDPKKDNTRLQPWVEKYRPKSLDDVAAQDHTIDILRRTLQSSNLPHMLFYGPPGTGKTSTILALSRSLFGPALSPTRVLELNASDERGISIVRSKIKDFARQQLSQPPLHSIPHPTTGELVPYKSIHPCPPYKIIILDEADSMTQDAQSALRRTMETYSRITRFCLVCNYVTRIIDPVASRCSKFRFKSLGGEKAGERLKEIAEREGVRLEDGAVEALVRCCEGDLRRGVQYLQSAARFVAGRKAEGKKGGKEKEQGKPKKGERGRKKKKVVESEDEEGEEGDKMEIDGGEEEEKMSTEKKEEAGIVTVRSIEEIAGTIPGNVIEELVEAMQPKKKGSTYEAIAKCVRDMVADGWSAGQAVTQLQATLLLSDLIPSTQRNKIALVFSEIDKRLVDGADEELTILDLCLRVAKVLDSPVGASGAG